MSSRTSSSGSPSGAHSGARIGLWIGDSFAEAISQTSSSKSSTSQATRSSNTTARWFLPKKSVADLVRATLDDLGAAAKKGGEIFVASSRTDSALARKQGNEPALLVTAGFEAWARLSSKNSMHIPSLRADRAWFPTSIEQTFGIEERISNEGKIERALKMEELEFLAEKLSLTKTKEIAIGFLHANKYPEHEKQAAQFFREKGFKVLASHEMPNAGSYSESTRWRRTLEAVYAESILQEEVESLRTVLKEKELEDKWALTFWGENGVTQTPTAASTRGGVEAAAAASLPDAYEIGYFFGLEEFMCLKRVNENGVGHVRQSPLPVQPTCQIGPSAWPFPSWTGVDRGYEPGPMLFGKSHQLTILDVLYVRGRLKPEIQAFSEQVQEKAQARILEALSTLGKELSEFGRRTDAKLVAEDLETAAVERLVLELNALDAKTKSVYVAGPLATTVLPLIEKRRPDLKFVFDANGSLAWAALATDDLTVSSREVQS